MISLLRSASVALLLVSTFGETTFLTQDQPQLELLSDAPLNPYLTPDFTQWLAANGYSDFKFERTDLPGGSYGGKLSTDDTVVNQPIIFLHGNSDSAIGGSAPGMNGWTNSINYFLSQGYKESELYATTWGPADPDQVTEQYHSYAYLHYLRNFVQAVLSYTQADKINIIGHSMGVTLGRKIIKGGDGTDTETYHLGDSLADNVDVFLGIAGGNWGLTPCYDDFEFPTCGMVNGFYPGEAPGMGLSTYLSDLNTVGGKEGDYVFTMLSTADDLIGFGDIVWGQYTSQIPDENGSKIYDNYDHMDMKDKTCDEQYKIITNKKISS